MYLKKKVNYIITCIILGAVCLLSVSCSTQEQTSLIVYAGKGLKNAMEDIKQSFEQQEYVQISIIYAGSRSLLTTLSSSRKGDVFIPGSFSYIKKAGSLVTENKFVAYHIPIFVSHKDNRRTLESYSDLLASDIKIAVGNKDMAAIGKVAESILNDINVEEKSFRSNVVITASTVNELMDLVIDKEVDSALVWRDMLQWDIAQDLKEITIPESINKPKKIHVGILSFSSEPELAKRFTDFVATKGRSIFTQHGFSQPQMKKNEN